MTKNITHLKRTCTFLLVFMTEFQAKLYKTFAEKIVCVDATHNTNQYGFQLVSIVVADEFRNGEWLLQ